MTRFPKITVEAWTDEGPAYTVHHSLAGFRNRKKRQAGVSDAERIGDHGAEPVSVAAAYLVFVNADDELWAFNEGHVYEIEQIVDGESSIIHVDAREEVVLHPFRDGVQLLAWKGLTEDELAALLEIVDPEDPQPTDAIGDPSESQERAGAFTVTDLSGESTQIEGAPPVEWASEGLVPITPEEADELLRAKIEEHADLYPDTTPDAATDEATEAARDPEPAFTDAQDEALAREGDYEANLDAVLEERDAAAPDEPSEGDDEDAIGGDGSPSASTEEE